MVELPLFPLNTVLFPGMQLKLHIFEERYKVMVNECIEAQKPFGVALIKRGREALGAMAAPHEVGCSARIEEVHRLPFDRLNILANGQRRFRIQAIARSHPYMLGDVRYFSLREDRPDVSAHYGKLLRPLLIQYLQLLSSVEEIRFDPDQIPHSPKSLAQVASILLQAENIQKQTLLSLESLSKLLRQLVERYRLETMLLKIRLSPPDEHFNIGPFSSN